MLPSVLLALLALAAALFFSWRLRTEPSAGAGDARAGGGPDAGRDLGNVVPWPADPDVLRALARPELEAGERHELLARLGEGPVILELSVARVARTAEMRAPEPYRSGLTLFGRCGDLELAVRFPPDRDTDLDGLLPAELAKVRAWIEGWDALTRRLVLNAMTTRRRGGSAGQG